MGWTTILGMVIAALIAIFTVGFIKHYIPKILAWKNKKFTHSTIRHSNYKDNIIKVLQDFENGPKNIGRYYQ